VTEAERIWSEKSDEELVEAAATLDEFTPDGQRVIRAELKRRGLEDPVEQAGEDGEGLGDETPPGVECLRCNVSLRLLHPDASDHAAGWSMVRGLRTLLELTDSFNVYVCPQCGHVELFAQIPLGEDTHQ
jgi:rubrerythrin